MIASLDEPVTMIKHSYEIAWRPLGKLQGPLNVESINVNQTTRQQVHLKSTFCLSQERILQEI